MKFLEKISPTIDILQTYFRKQTELEVIKDYEIMILTFLDFELNIPTVYKFYEHFNTILPKLTKAHRDFGNFLLQLIIFDQNILQNYSLSLIALGVLEYSSKMINKIDDNEQSQK